MKTNLISLIILISCSYCLPFNSNYIVQESSFQSDTLTLFADIYIPQKNKKNVGIVLIQGSGNSGRSNLWSKLFAETLANYGYHVLLPDKRGVGNSDGDWKTSSFEDLSDDVIASVYHLDRFTALNRIGIMGLSQGGFVAPIAAIKDTTIKFVINVVGAAVTLEEQIIHEITNTAINNGLKPKEITEVIDLHVLMKQYAFKRNWAPLEKRFIELKSSSWSEFASTFPNNQDIWVWDWIKVNIEYNPMEYWENVKQHVFIAYGSKDQNDNMPVYQSVYRLQEGFTEIGKENYQINIYETGHAMYEDDKAVLRNEFINDLLKWLQNLDGA